MSEIDIRENTVILNLTLGKPGNRKKIKQNAVKVTAVGDTEDSNGPDQSMLHVHKDILDSPELVGIGKFFSGIRREVESEALPTTTLKAGMYRLAPIPLTRVINTLTTRQAELVPMINAFREVYPQKVEESMERLGELADPLDYPDVEEIVSAFKFEWHILTYDVPRATLGRISQKLLAQEEAKIRAQAADEAIQIRRGLAEAFQAPLNYLMELLRPTDGKKKKVTDKVVEKFNSLAEKFQEQNVTGDDELAELIGQIQMVVNAATPEEINTVPNIKDLVASKMDAIKAHLDTLVVSRGRRKVYLDDDDTTIAA